ncbi:uncharacterized protein LOC117008715 isoform X1 [Catharus ustulatus]|uniref:uncharacterized protein LOC117008715 isoform X1 n=1 Tax=Catharus ustulatus TaxID=91951 RepID=UPI00140C61C8|nr:uncharacterized protein LOC117008715 isoform X1 [Catharus ustulatus]
MGNQSHPSSFPLQLPGSSRKGPPRWRILRPPTWSCGGHMGNLGNPVTSMAIYSKTSRKPQDRTPRRMGLGWTPTSWAPSGQGGPPHHLPQVSTRSCRDPTGDSGTPMTATRTFCDTGGHWGHWGHLETPPEGPPCVSPARFPHWAAALVSCARALPVLVPGAIGAKREFAKGAICPGPSRPRPPWPLRGWSWHRGAPCWPEVLPCSAPCWPGVLPAAPPAGRECSLQRPLLAVPRTAPKMNKQP